ncbi:MAG: ankyrin repeat domain-containing protein [Candidatus Competibacter sp.]|nr:ankyrin repeat domain-containing protein [Candidatus Competibacter sp.]
MSDRVNGDRHPRSEKSLTADLSRALQEGDPQKISALIEAGADIHYQREGGYNALLDAVHGLTRNTRLLDLLAWLAAQGVELSAVSDYAESALRVLSRFGRFDAVRLLLDAGADKNQLKWTPLMEAVALGSLDDVETVFKESASLEARDWWSRTAWLIALLVGDISKAKLLAAWGADTNACGRCGHPPLFYAVQSHSPQMVRWLLENGADVRQTDKFGSTALIEAVENDDLECVEILIEAGSDLEAHPYGTALSIARSRNVLLCLLDAGANPAELTYEGQRAMLNFPPIGDQALDDVSLDDFQRSFTRTFGRHNPERMRVPYWEAMIRCGASAYGARNHFNKPFTLLHESVWCANRFGQSLTLLPDGRAIQIGGEHEDSYDPDFCIYNDVFVHEPSGAITVYGYPESVFPPTDFHTATLAGHFIYVIGALGYYGTRRYGETSIYRLDSRTLQMERVEPEGKAPGWIYNHRATAFSPTAIRVWQGTVLTENNGKEASESNPHTYVLNLDLLRWTRQ